MNDLLEELCSALEKEGVDFDRNDQKDLNILAKSFVLAMQGKENGDKVKEDYFKIVVEDKQKKKMNIIIKERGQEPIKYELAKLNFEKEIIERQIKITKEFMN